LVDEKTNCITLPWTLADISSHHGLVLFDCVTNKINQTLRSPQQGNERMILTAIENSSKVLSCI
jgi:adenosyl cobinamide kinase/adenosyl cobinamide phosphate guanylyltransferase